MSTPRNELDRPGIHPETPLSPKDFCSQALTKLKEAGFPFDQVINSCLYLPQTMTDAYQAQRPNCVDVLLVCSPEMIEPTAPVSVFADGPNNTLNIRLHPTIREININSPPIKLPDPKRSGEHLTIDAVRKTVHPDFRTTDELLELGSLENGKKGVLLIGVYKDKEGVKGSITWMETPQDYQRRYFEHSRALDQNGRPIEQQFMVAPPLQPDIKLSQSVTPAAGDKPKVLPVIKSEPLTPKPQDRLLETVNSAIRFEARGLPPITPSEASRRIQRLAYSYDDKSTIPPYFPADFAEILKRVIVADCRNLPSPLRAQLIYIDKQSVQIPIFVDHDIYTLYLKYSSLPNDGLRSYEYSVDKNRMIISSGTIGLGETRSGYCSLPLFIIKPHGGIGLIEMGSENFATLDQAFDERGNLKPVNAELFRPSTKPTEVRTPRSKPPDQPVRNLETVLAPFPVDIYEGVYQALKPYGFSPEFVKEKLRPQEAVAIYKTEAGETKLPFPILVVSPNDTRSQQDLAVFLEEPNVRLSAGVKKFWIVLPELPRPDGTQAKLLLDHESHNQGKFFALYGASDFTHSATKPPTHVNIEKIISGTDNSSRIHIPLIAVSPEKPGKPRELVLTSIQIKSGWLDELKRSLASKEPVKQPKPKPAPLPITGQVFPPPVSADRTRKATISQSPARFTPQSPPLEETFDQKTRREARKREEKIKENGKARQRMAVEPWLEESSKIPTGSHSYRLDLPRFRMWRDNPGEIDLESCLSSRGNGILTVTCTGSQIEASLDGKEFGVYTVSKENPTIEVVKLLYLLKTMSPTEANPPTRRSGNTLHRPGRNTPEERMKEAFATVPGTPESYKPPERGKPKPATTSDSPFQSYTPDYGGDYRPRPTTPPKPNTPLPRSDTMSHEEYRRMKAQRTTAHKIEAGKRARGKKKKK